MLSRLNLIVISSAVRTHAEVSSIHLTLVLDRKQWSFPDWSLSRVATFWFACHIWWLQRLAFASLGSGASNRVRPPILFWSQTSHFSAPHLPFLTVSLYYVNQAWVCWSLDFASVLTQIAALQASLVLQEHSQLSNLTCILVAWWMHLHLP